MTSYLYARPGLLRQPSHYMYPPYGGEDFLCAWAKDRQHAMMTLEQNLTSMGPCVEFTLPGACLKLFESLTSPQEDAVSQILRQSEASWPRSEPTEMIRPEAVVKLSPLVRGILLRAASGQTNVAADSLWLMRLTRKFEITKRLFPAYLPHPRHGLGKPLDPDAGNQDIRLHALLATALGLCSGINTDLTHLNAQLKLNDMLCSELSALPSHPEAAALMLLSLRTEAWRVVRLSPGGASWR